MLLAAGGLHPRLLALRQEYRLNQAAPLENSPPLVAFTTVALGGFRGILADLLWIRASTLQEEGRYFELVQLSDWITKLEPRFTTVWAYQAWNMTYNISVLFNNPEDRWRWVRQGIALLRDEGLKYNPGDTHLFRELGWLFQHKIGMDYDQAQLYYKKAWAAEMTRLFQLGTNPSPHLDFASLSAETVQRMKQDYRLDPNLMEKLDREYGPFDWRLAQAHALYWACSGKPYATGFEAIATDRMILQCLAEAVKSGRLIEDPARDLFVMAPQLNLLPQALKAYRETNTRYAAEKTFATAYQNFLQGAILLLYTCNQNAEALDLYRRVQSEFPDELSGNFDQDIVSLFAGTRETLSPENATAVVNEALQQSLKWEAQGDPEQARGFAQLAQLCWTVFNAQHPLPPLTGAQTF
ncbi:MAG: hypothetical protein A2X46_01585 [Lentisphaerae bacterium GWF2_57_35]|nr:MAG: hypothetical protein A2X46_01585 [Lentisphaerae bacterium GWF2_57_35]